MRVKEPKATMTTCVRSAWQVSQLCSGRLNGFQRGQAEGRHNPGSVDNIEAPEQDPLSKGNCLPERVLRSQKAFQGQGNDRETLQDSLSNKSLAVRLLLFLARHR